MPCSRGCSFSNFNGGCGALSVRLFDAVSPSSKTLNCGNRGITAQLNRIEGEILTLDSKVNEILERQDTLLDFVTKQVFGELVDVYNLLQYCCDEEQTDLREILAAL